MIRISSPSVATTSSGTILPFFVTITVVGVDPEFTEDLFYRRGGASERCTLRSGRMILHTSL